jgi:predicted CXXCH cytochrome family protein
VRLLRYLSASTAVGALVLFAAGCTEDSATPPELQLDGTFVGYTDPQTHQTTCGNCHIEKQQDWQATKHAQAWNDMQATGHASSSCYQCHSTSGFSNSSPDTTGFFAVDSAAQKYYFDVQCESCHGSGAAHVSGPESTQPIATIVADTGATAGCGTCHSGAHNPFVEEWRESGHGQFMNGEWRDPCWNCHESNHALARFDPEARWLEQGTTQYQQVAVCTVCHEPHGSPNDHQLRYPVNERDLTTNLCMQCHNNRAAPVGGSSRGNQGHGTQGQVFLGIAGWIPPNFDYDTSLIQATHGSDANPRTCAGCHVNKFQVTSGGVTTYNTGHSFNPTPCVDANGIPVEGVGIGGCPVAERTFRNCAVSGCHTSENAARGALVAESTTVQVLVNTLWVDVDGDKVIDTVGVDQGLLPTVKKLFPTEINPNNTTITVGDGAEFNTRMFAPNLADHPDGSRGAHNPFYYQALLAATINSVRATYGLPAPPAEVRFMAELNQRIARH